MKFQAVNNIKSLQINSPISYSYRRWPTHVKPKLKAVRVMKVFYDADICMDYPVRSKITLSLLSPKSV